MQKIKILFNLCGLTLGIFVILLHSCSNSSENVIENGFIGDLHEIDGKWCVDMDRDGTENLLLINALATDQNLLPSYSINSVKKKIQLMVEDEILMEETILEDNGRYYITPEQEGKGYFKKTDDGNIALHFKDKTAHWVKCEEPEEEN